MHPSHRAPFTLGPPLGRTASFILHTVCTHNRLVSANGPCLGSTHVPLSTAGSSSLICTRHRFCIALFNRLDCLCIITQYTTKVFIMYWMTWAAASAIIPGATAFYPYEPKYDGSNEQTRRAPLPILHPRARDAPRRSLTLPLRRIPIRPRDNTYTIVNSVDPKQKNSVAVDQDGSDLSYMAAVTIGSSKEEYHLLLDSAASNTWLMSQDCKSEACGKHNTFGKGDSDSLKVSVSLLSSQLPIQRDCGGLR